METIKKKCSIALLRADDQTGRRKNQLCLSGGETPNKLFLSDDDFEDTLHAPHELYIMSDEKIEEGDWYMYIDLNGRALFPLKNEGSTSPDDLDKKIIATTNPKLINRRMMKGQACPLGLVDDGFDYDLPRPSVAFLHKYVEKGGIEEAMVQYQRVEWNMSVNPTKVGTYVPKVSKDFHITILKTKESWNREEVENLIRRAMQSKGYTPEYEVREFCKENL